MDNPVCLLCKNAHGLVNRYLWIVRWPFNFRYIDCVECGPVWDEHGLWHLIENVALFLVPFDGFLHERPHRWWKKSLHA